MTRKDTLKTFLPSATCGYRAFRALASAFSCYPLGIMNYCLLERTDVILFTSTRQRQVHINTVIIFYFLICRFWLDSWARNSLAPFACMCARKRSGTWNCFVLSTLSHTSSCWNTQLWDGTAPPCFICCERVASLKDWKGWDAVPLPPVFVISGKTMYA